MLTEAQIEIVDDTGHVEDRVRIVGTGEVALATKDTPHVRAVEVPTASLMSAAGAVIRDEPSELERWAAASAARGAAKVSAQLARLRAAGAIDDRGHLLVPLPEDMKPESKTDV